MSGREVSLDGVAGDHRVVDQQAQCDDERGDRDLLQIDAEREHDPERHRQRDRNRERHQQRRAPFPEADERHDDDERDRLVEAAHEQVDAFLHLARLIGRAREHQVVRKLRPELVERRVHLHAEVADLLGGAHLDGQRHRARAAPRAVGFAVAVVVDEVRRALVAALHRGDVAQVERLVVARRHQHVADLALVLEFTRGIDEQVLVARLDDAARHGDVAGAEDVVERARLDTVGRETLL
jgi:hypothetical protein